MPENMIVFKMKMESPSNISFSEEDEVEVDREDWESWSPMDRQKFMEERLDNFIGEHVDAWWEEVK